MVAAAQTIRLPELLQQCHVISHFGKYFLACSENGTRKSVNHCQQRLLANIARFICHLCNRFVTDSFTSNDSDNGTCRALGRCVMTGSLTKRKEKKTILANNGATAAVWKTDINSDDRSHAPEFSFVSSLRTDLCVIHINMAVAVETLPVRTSTISL